MNNVLRQYKMSDYGGKKLLFIGATSYACDFINLAREQDIYTIVTDYYPNAPAKKIADQSYDVSTIDYEAVLKIAIENSVDAIAVGWSDINLTIAQAICEKLRLPFYATREQLAATLNKRTFKRLCVECGVPAVQEYNLDADFKDDDLEKIEYPVIVKPVDNGSSKGVSICKDKNELKEKYFKALAYSYCKDVIIERFMPAGMVIYFYTMQDGYISLSAMMDKYVQEELPDVIPHFTAFVFPSKYLDGRHLQFHRKMCGLIKRLKLQNGTLFVETYIDDDGSLCAGEMGYRLSGTREYRIIAQENGIDSLQMYLNHAMTGRFSGWDIKATDNPYFKHIYSVLVMVLGSGTISRIEGISEIKTSLGVFDIIQLRNIGDRITATGTADEYFARVYITADNAESLAERIKHVQNVLKVLDENENNMLLKGFNTEILLKDYV
ncbi:MAG: ATP-binding protein [Flavisolibacter sp.]